LESHRLLRLLHPSSSLHEVIRLMIWLVEVVHTPALKVVQRVGVVYIYNKWREVLL